ncbi:hypothetical protein AB0B94_20895 [Micromonospora sp. NPDC048986]|uniref:hypothetical protein n=1 Tax=Micromonospora sp. NPDC048986 TaxID=3155644 RepID=UPI0033FDEDD9
MVSQALSLVIAEELNATIGQLVNFWAETRSKGDPMRSPAVPALADMLFVGRSAKVDVLPSGRCSPLARSPTRGTRDLRHPSGASLGTRPPTEDPCSKRGHAARLAHPRPMEDVIGGQASKTHIAYLTASELGSLHFPGCTGTSQAIGTSSPAGDFLTLQQVVTPEFSPDPTRRLQRRGCGTQGAQQARER